MFGRYPRRSATIRTRVRTSELTRSWPLSARDAVARETPLVRATSSSVTGRDLLPASSCGTTVSTPARSKLTDPRLPWKRFHRTMFRRRCQESHRSDPSTWENAMSMGSLAMGSTTPSECECNRSHRRSGAPATTLPARFRVGGGDVVVPDRGRPRRSRREHLGPLLRRAGRDPRRQQRRRRLRPSRTRRPPTCA